MWKMSIAFASLLCLINPSPTHAKSIPFKVDNAHTSILFSARHLMISNVRGTFENTEGVINLDTTDITKSSAEVIVKVLSLNTRNAKRDSHLLSRDFFDAKTYPEMRMRVKRIYKKGTSYWADGDLTIKGITKSIAFPFELEGPLKDPWGNLRIGISAKFEINRFDYGVSWNKTLEGGGFVVGKKVKVEVEMEAVHSRGK